MCDDKLLYFDYNTRQITEAYNIILDQYCNDLTVKNVGNSVVMFDDDPIQPQQSKSIGGNRLEILKGGGHKISFTLNFLIGPPPLVRNDMAIMTQKYYTEL